MLIGELRKRIALSRNHAADVPSSKVSDRVPCNPRMNSTIVAALVSSRHSMINLPPASITATEIVAWCTSHADILFLTHKGAPFR